jgi:LemA protein
MKRGMIGIVVLGAIIVLLGFSCASTYNSLVGLDQEVDQRWAQVENVYQRRADLVPNLVETVKGAAKFEQETLTRVIEARAKATQVTVSPEALTDPAAFRRFEQVQGELGSALSRLLAVTEAYPELKATQNFRDLQAQLEGTENRITVERQRFNEAAQQFNTRRNRFPTVLIASFFGSRFTEKAYFQARPGAENVPEVKF